MAELNGLNYQSGGGLSVGLGGTARVVERYVDFTNPANQLAAATDSLNLFGLPKGSAVLGAGMEQIVAGASGNTLAVRVGTVALSGTLASDAAVGTTTANADVSGGAPVALAADGNINLISASGVRSTGKVRVWVSFQEAFRKEEPKLMTRDQLA